jgi:hypothetical protein
MPAPDPEGLDLEEYENGGFRVIAEVWEHGNRRNRIARMKAVSRNIYRGGWRCWRCSKPVPLYKRADAQYCSEGCRKKAARERRERRPR